MPTSRYEREVDIEDPSVVPTSRFEHMSREVLHLQQAILDGSILDATLVDGGIQLVLTPNHLCGSYPSFEVGLVCLGEALESDAPLQEVKGVTLDSGPIESEFLRGAHLTVFPLGGYLLATWRRSLPIRSFEYQGKLHQVHRSGVRRAQGITLVETTLTAISGPEVIQEGSLLSV